MESKGAIEGGEIRERAEVWVPHSPVEFSKDFGFFILSEMESH